MKYLSLNLLILIIYTTSSSAVFAASGNQLTIAGWLETVILSPWQTRLRAKLDTGAKTSSIHAENIKEFTRDGEQWVSFNLPQGKRAKADEIQRVEMPIIRDVMIKRHDMPPAIRYVVEMGFCLNQRYYTTEFTLADRQNFNYPILLGRHFLNKTILVDSSDSFLHRTRKKASCQPEASQATEQTSKRIQIYYPDRSILYKHRELSIEKSTCYYPRVFVGTSGYFTVLLQSTRAAFTADTGGSLIGLDC